MNLDIFNQMDWNPNLALVVSGFFACIACFPLTIWASRAAGLVDTPTDRKIHDGSIPLVGGVTVYIAIVFVSTMVTRDWINESMLVWLGLVLLTGVIDDLTELHATVRLLAHALIIICIYSTDGLLIHTVGNLFGTGPVMFSTFGGLCFTIIAVLGAVNSVNMIDGVDGLLGSVAIVSLLSLLMIVGVASIDEFSPRSFNIAEICIVLGTLCAFMLVNSRFFLFKKAVVFLGDAGSTIIGFCIVYILIDYSQGNYPLISPVTAGWILGLPLLDASAVIGKRAFQLKSPIAPGRDHIHHILLDSGISVNKTVGILVLLHCILVLIGVSAPIFLGTYADPVLFWLFVGLVLLRIAATDTITSRLKYLQLDSDVGKKTNTHVTRPTG